MGIAWKQNNLECAINWNNTGVLERPLIVWMEMQIAQLELPLLREKKNN